MIENIKGVGNTIEIPESLRENRMLKVDVNGKGNHLDIAEGCRVGRCQVSIRGHGNSIKVSENCLMNGSIVIRANDAHISIGSGTTIMGAQISLHEAGHISIGEDCMLSGGILMDVSDMHSIIELSSGRRINPPEDIIISDHVWIAQGVTILKGVEIGHHSIIGARALVAKKVPPYTLSVGVPSEVVREGITWDRKRLPLEDSI